MGRVSTIYRLGRVLRRPLDVRDPFAQARRILEEVRLSGGEAESLKRIAWSMNRGPEGIIVELAERIG